MTTTPDVTTTVDTYLAMLNETDDVRRAELAAQAWVEDGSYVDPLALAQGRDEIVAMVGAVQAQYPGHRFTRTSGVDAHHSLVRFSWRMAGPDGSVTVDGLDVGIIAEDGRLSRIGGFFGPLPEA